VIEVRPGIHRIESVLGPRPFSQYLLRDGRSLLVDTGTCETPRDVILPFLDGLQPDYVLLTHADVDHFGGNAALRAAAPRALFLAHRLDAPWIESSELILRERYGWYDAHGLSYDPDTMAWLRNALGPEVPLDVLLTGDETIRLGDALSVQVLHIPGHSPGHVGLWEPRSRTAIVTDAVLARGLLDMAGHVIHPPSYFDLDTYLETVRRLQSLRPEVLLTAHYDVIEGAAVDAFLEASLAFADDAEAVVKRELAAADTIDLATLLERADPELGPFTSMANELAAPLRAHLRRLVREGLASEDAGGLSWSAR
jgi:glyoxylase-like metal-dependent hydrolase (beta-lactamase superfamily II)